MTTKLLLLVLLIRSCYALTNITNVKIGYVAQELRDLKYGEPLYFSVTIPANLSVTVIFNEDCDGSCSLHNSTFLKEGSMPNNTYFDYDSYPILIKKSEIERTFYGMVNITSNDTRSVSVLALPNMNFFTAESMQYLNQSLSKPNLIMIYVILQFRTPPQNMSTEVSEAMHAFESLYLTAWDSALYIKP